MLSRITRRVDALRIHAFNLSCFSYRSSCPFDFDNAVSKNNHIVVNNIALFFFFLTEKRIRIIIQEDLLIYSFLLKILSYILHYIKILIRLLFYKINFKIIAMNLFKKKKNPSGLDLPKTYPDVRNLPRRSTCIIESNELIQLRWYHSFPSRGSKHDDAQLNVHTMRFRISVPITVSNGEITQTRINLETH